MLLVLLPKKALNTTFIFGVPNVNELLKVKFFLRYFLKAEIYEEIHCGGVRQKKTRQTNEPPYKINRFFKSACFIVPRRKDLGDCCDEQNDTKNLVSTCVG